MYLKYFNCFIKYKIFVVRFFKKISKSLYILYFLELLWISDIFSWYEYQLSAKWGVLKEWTLHFPEYVYYQRKIINNTELNFFKKKFFFHSTLLICLLY